MKKSLVLKCIIFVIIGILVAYPILRVFGVSNEYSEHAEMMINGYYESKEDSADVVIVGNSHVYRYFQCAFAWKECGLAANSWSTSDLPFGAIRNVVIEALKTQSPKVVIIDATVFANKKDVTNNKIYLLTQNMHISKNYFEMIENYCDYSNVKWTDKLQYYFPVIQFHDRWNDISIDDFEQTMPSYLNSCYQEKFLTSVYTGEEHVYTDMTDPIAPQSEKALRDMLEWCKQQDDVEFLFFVAPVLEREERQGRFNLTCDIIEENGFKVINFNDKEWYEPLDLDDSTDYQDINHTNIKGSYKFTKYFANYLMEEYDIPDRRNEEDYASWNEASDKYYDIVGDYIK